MAKKESGNFKRNLLIAGGIGVGVGIVPFLVIAVIKTIFGIQIPEWFANFVLHTFELPLFLAIKITNLFGCYHFGCVAADLLIALTIYFLLGMLIYFICYKIKN